MLRSSFQSFTYAGVLFAFAPSAAADGSNQPEFLVPFDCSTSFEPYQIGYNTFTVNCAFETPNDVDTFQFQGQKDERVAIHVTDQTGGIWVSAELRDSMGTLIGSSGSSGGFFFQPDLPSADTYTLTLSEVGANNTGDYTLWLERVLPLPSFARALPYNQPVADTIDRVNDLDYFVFCAVSGSRVRVSVQPLTSGLDPRFDLYDPSGAYLTTRSSTGSLTYEFAPQVTGAYSIVMREWGIDNVGDYDIGVSCVLNCPTVAGTIVRNGTGINPAAYAVVSPAAIGTCWRAEIDTSSVANASLAAIVLHAAPAGGPIIKQGEVLIDLGSPRVGSLVAPASSGLASFSARLPKNLSLVGMIASSQGVIFGDKAQLTNAADLLVGY